ncbi:Phosphotransferase enzyme family protein [compost metagenome]
MKIGELIGIGNTARIYKWGNTEVIKVFHDHFNSIYEAQKEDKNAELINKLKLRSPKYSGVVEYEGKSCLIYEKIDGQTMLWRIEPTSVSISYYAKQMAQLQFEIHNDQVVLEPNLKMEISNMINDVEVLSEYEKETIKDVLNVLPEGKAVCHYDFHPDNIIISSKGPIVIDWINVLIGNQVADVTRTSMMLMSKSVPPNAPKWLLDRQYREYFNEEYLKEYHLLAGIDNKIVDEWMAPTLAYRIGEMKNELEHENVKKLKKILKD